MESQNKTKYPKRIKIPVPRERICVITSEESGYDKNQVFESNVLPHYISWKLIDEVERPDGTKYPKYLAETTIGELRLQGINGYQNAIEILNKICYKLIWKTGMAEVGSVTKKDLKKFEYDKEKMRSYWLASHSVDFYNAYAYLTVRNVNIDHVESLYLYYAYGYEKCLCYAVRPICVLTSKVDESEVLT